MVGNFWSSGYYVSTVSEHGNEEVIANYVKNQGNEYKKFTANTKVKRNKCVEENIGLIKEHYPAVRWTEEVFHTFHSALMGKELSQMDKFMEKYTNSSINGFCECIKYVL